MIEPIPVSLWWGKLFAEPVSHSIFPSLDKRLWIHEDASLLIVMVNIDCQLSWVWNQVTGKLIDTLVKNFLDHIN